MLFVCVGNACRSPMAEGLANRFGRDVLVALSAGLTPVSKAPAHMVTVMKERNVDMSGHVPQLYDPREAEECDVVVNMSGMKLAGVPSKKLLEWKVEDPFGEKIETYRKVRDELEGKVMKLILDLRLQASKKAGS